MTIQEFKRDHYCKLTIQDQGNGNLIIISEAIRRTNDQILHRAESTIDIQKANDWIFDSNSSASITPWSSEQLIEEYKRSHLTYFAQKVPIDDWRPSDYQTNPDISDVYIKSPTVT